MANCEDLATKAELQELRDQLNVVLGEKEEGGVVEVFKAGAPITNTATQLAGTAYVATKARSFDAIKNIVFDNPVNEPIYRDFANGNAKWTAVKGSGSRVPLPDLSKIGKVAGTNTVAVGATATAGAGLAASTLLLANLVTIAGTLLLNIATVKVLDGRIEAEARGTKLQLDALNSSMLRLYDKQQGDIDAVVADLEANQEVVRQNQQAIEATRFEVQRANEINSEQSRKITEANEAIRQLRIDNNNLREQVNQERIEAQEIIDGIITQLDTVEANLNQAQEIINEQQITIEQQQLSIESLEARTTELEKEIESIEDKFEDLRNEFRELKASLSSDVEDIDDRLTKFESKLIKDQKTGVSFAGAAAAAAAKNAVAAQDATLRVVSKVVDVPYRPVGDGVNTSYNRTTEFNRRIDALIPQIVPGGGSSMTPQQIEEFQTQLRTGLGTDIDALLRGNVVPRLNDISNQVTDRRMADNVQAGICQSLNSPNPCSTVPGGRTTQGLRGMQQGLEAGQQNLNNVLGGANLLANQSIYTIVQNTNSVVNSATHGLAKIQSFAETAWKATRADKIMNGITMALTIHNGMMLSNNLLSTVSEALNFSLEAVGLRDETDAPIDIGKAISDKIKAILNSLLGDEQYKLLTARIAKANRIYQASVNVLDATNDLFDSARSTAELTAENTGQIGNALLDAGVVAGDAYRPFAERINPQSKAQRNLEKFRGTLEGIVEPIETVTQISSEVIDFQNNVEQLKDAKSEWKQEIETEVVATEEEREEARNEVQVTADVNEGDFDAIGGSE